MGIKEFFQEQPSDRDLNIHNLEIKGERRKEDLFDFDAEITDSDWQAIKDRFKPNVLSDLHYIAALKID